MHIFFRAGQVISDWFKWPYERGFRSGSRGSLERGPVGHRGHSEARVSRWSVGCESIAVAVVVAVLFKPRFASRHIIFCLSQRLLPSNSHFILSTW